MRRDGSGRRAGVKSEEREKRKREREIEREKERRDRESEGYVGKMGSGG